ncbi:MAG TPA: FAD-binding oxidoreductase [Kofleriaceae bacterium]|jgi:FAD/FMN-containing dehydrogenase
MRNPEVAAWAASRDIAITWPEDYVRDPNAFHDNPCIDFGRVVWREPQFVVRPRSVDQLVDCVTMLRDRATPYHVRGAGHSSGGQALTDGGAVIHTGGLSRIIEERPDADQIVVEGGTWWLSVIEQLQAQGRRPVSLTGNPRVSVAGTLAVGGFGDTSHVEGLVIDSVDAITLIAPDGTRHALRRGDELFHYALAGRGQLGVIAEATVRTVRKPLQVTLRYVRWGSLRDFVRDSAIIARHRLYEYVRARMFWEHASEHVDAGVGNFGASTTAPDAINLIRPVSATSAQVRDLLADLRREPSGDEWLLPTPAMEIALPLPDGLGVWPRIRDRVVAGGLVPFLGRGTSVMVVPPKPELPLAPVAGRNATLLIALRPEAPAERVRELLPAMRAIGEMALAAGGRIHLISIELDTPRFVERQFGDAIAARFRALKARLDPGGLCNPGLL